MAASVRPLWRAARHVLDVHRLDCLYLHPLLSADQIMSSMAPTARSRSIWRPAVPAFVVIDLRAGLLHEPGQGRRLQAHSGLLPRTCRRGRRAGRHDRRPWRLRAAAVVRCRDRPDRPLARAASCCCSLLVVVALVWMHFAILQMECGPPATLAGKAAGTARNAGNPRSRTGAPACRPCRRPIGGRKIRRSGRRRAVASRSAICGSPSRHCCCPSPSGWCGRSWWPSCRRSASPSHRSALLAGGAAGPVRRDAAHLLFLHGADLRRPAVDDADDLVADDPGPRHRLCGAEPRYALCRCCLALALLCGFGGGNFASSMANISFFFPKAEKGNALALNAGLGNLGVSVVQFVVPIVITSGVFGWLGGAAAGSRCRWHLAHVAAERRLHLGAVHRHLGLCRLVRHERYRRAPRRPSPNSP